jgi:hypothetical protein
MRDILTVDGAIALMELFLRSRGQCLVPGEIASFREWDALPPWWFYRVGAWAVCLGPTSGESIGRPTSGRIELRTGLALSCMTTLLTWKIVLRGWPARRKLSISGGIGNCGKALITGMRWKSNNVALPTSSRSARSQRRPIHTSIVFGGAPRKWWTKR